MKEWMKEQFSNLINRLLEELEYLDYWLNSVDAELERDDQVERTFEKDSRYRMNSTYMIEATFGCESINVNDIPFPSDNCQQSEIPISWKDLRDLDFEVQLQKGKIADKEDLDNWLWKIEEVVSRKMHFHQSTSVLTHKTVKRRINEILLKYRKIANDKK